jgi:hypothetical protein
VVFSVAPANVVIISHIKVPSIKCYTLWDKTPCSTLKLKLGLFFYLEDGGDMSLRNVIADDTALHNRSCEDLKFYMRFLLIY